MSSCPEQQGSTQNLIAVSEGSTKLYFIDGFLLRAAKKTQNLIIVSEGSAKLYFVNFLLPEETGNKSHLGTF